jgi:uncharacterized protein YgiM (DUF1202 family)
MRTKIMLALAAGWASVGVAAAQTIPADRVVAQDVEARSGPGTNFYPTSKLKAGEHVKVRRVLTDQPGWLEIEPPAGSYNWINTKFLKQDAQDPRQWFVTSQEPAQTIPGSSIEGTGRPNVFAPVRLKPGTIVVAIRAKVDPEGESWLPIVPHTDEARYIPATAVQPTTGAAKMNSPASWILTSQGTYTTDPVLAQAMDKEKANDRAGAVQLYQQIANNPNADPNSQVFARNALARLQQPAYGTVQGTTMSLSPANPTPSAALNLQTLKAPEWSVYGRLRATTLKTVDGQPLYSLEDARANVLTYVSTSPNKSLQNYIGRWIAVYGPQMYRPDAAVRMPYVVATHIAAP